MCSVRGVGAVVVEDGRILLVCRGRPPQAGRWSVPGGRVEPGETPQEAVVRELVEETGLAARCGRPLVEAAVTIEGAHYDITDYMVTIVGTRDPVAGDDAAAVRWVDLAAAEGLPLVEGLTLVLDAARAADWPKPG